ncbi:hypothetical protein U9M48_018474 [Paspalum notatum var. saurae]|uniref:Phospholipase/carboxylesterase/thioesterase domain-containing protein n=1 Tax=Paspalum notatum var. saurae TaxID=547442 RepID=A0AAQ3TAT1_PASNO
MDDMEDISKSKLTDRDAMWMHAGGGRGGRRVEYGRTYVVRPRARHQATIVWLHGLGDNGASWSQVLESLPLPNIKWICPTAPTRPVAAFGGFPCTAYSETKMILSSLCILFEQELILYFFSETETGFDVEETSLDGRDDIEGLDASAAHVANLLSSEPSDVFLGIGGFSMGAAAALHSAACYAHGRFTNGIPYPINLSIVVGLSGWLPCSMTLRSKIESSQIALRRASAMPILLNHGRADDVVKYRNGERSAEILRSSGFQYTYFKAYNGLGHYTIPEEMDDVSKWLSSTLGLDRSRG